jgi:hypothetical protein
MLNGVRHDSRIIRIAMDGHVEAGDWYLCARCKSCKAVIPIISCPAPPTPPFSGEGDFRFPAVPCFSCGVKYDYSIRELTRLRVQPAE